MQCWPSELKMSLESTILLLYCNWISVWLEAVGAQSLTYSRIWHFVSQGRSGGGQLYGHNPSLTNFLSLAWNEEWRHWSFIWDCKCKSAYNEEMCMPFRCGVSPLLNPISNIFSDWFGNCFWDALCDKWSWMQKIQLNSSSFYWMLFLAVHQLSEKCPVYSFLRPEVKWKYCSVAEISSLAEKDTVCICGTQNMNGLIIKQPS